MGERGREGERGSRREGEDQYTYVDAEQERDENNEVSGLLDYGFPVVWYKGERGKREKTGMSERRDRQTDRKQK